MTLYAGDEVYPDDVTSGVDLPWTHPTEPEPTVNVAAPRKCRRHRWSEVFSDGAVRETGLPRGTVRCIRPGCHAIRDEARVRRGRTNRARGLTIQRQRNAGLGITNIAGNAPNHDGGTHRDLFVSESKSGAAFSERYWRWLSAIPHEAGQTPILIVTEAPGRGRKARSIVVVEYGEWRALHGDGR